VALSADPGAIPSGRIVTVREVPLLLGPTASLGLDGNRPLSAVLTETIPASCVGTLWHVGRRERRRLSDAAHGPTFALPSVMPNGADDAPREANDANDVSTDASDAHQTDAAPDGGVCTEPFSTTSTGGSVDGFCAATYRDAVGPAYACRTHLLFVFSGSCGGLFAVGYWSGEDTANGIVCVYDGVDTGTLVGTEYQSDFPAFCNGTSSLVTAGRVPDACAIASSHVSPLLAPLDASCPPTDAAASTGVDGSDASAD
jgi:hypothetical protein